MQRKLHPLEGIVAICALVLVLFVSVGFAQAQEVKKIALRSSSALVQDADTGEVVIGKNADTVVPIASITKLMTAMVILDRGLDLEEPIKLSREDAVAMKGSRSRLRTGLTLTRGDLLLIALMASDNRAAAALGVSYPGGLEAFVDAMNAKAAMLDMNDSRFVEPTGLSPANVSTASDLAKMVRAAHDYPLIREYSTMGRATVKAHNGRRIQPLVYGNTNGLVRSKHWDIELSKTGYISEAGRCLVMHLKLLPS
jgi:D-alanyl-D-alanine endopeptidase (penicillin-binding protein 7)